MQRSRVGSFQIGNDLGEVGRQIGQGTFCEVREGIHLLTRELVAIKVFNRSKPERVRQSLKEWKILRELNHPNIIRVYELLETPTELYLVMQHVPNGELFNYVRACGRVQEKHAAKFFSQLLSVVAYLQQNKIVHRDIKPENILLTADNDIKLIDFGLSCSYEVGTKLTDCCGSPCYSLPQMLIGKSYDPIKADVWSAGMVLYVMVCGYLPYDQRVPKKLYEMSMREPMPLAPFLSTDVCDLLHNILNRDIQARFSLQEALCHKWLAHTRKEYTSLLKKTSINESVLEAMKLYGVEETYTISSLKHNDFNFSTTLYFMLEKKHLRQGCQQKPAIHKFKANSQETVESEHGKGNYKSNDSATEFDSTKNHLFMKGPKPTKMRTALRRLDAISVRLTSRKQSLSEGWDETASVLLRSKGGHSCKKLRQKISNKDGAQTPKTTINEDYFKDETIVLKTTRKKKMSLYDQAAVDFVSSHEYQSALLPQKKKTKKRSNV